MLNDIHQNHLCKLSYWMTFFFANSVQNSHATHRGAPTDSVNVQGEIICEMIMVNFSGFLTSLNWHSCLIKNQNHSEITMMILLMLMTVVMIGLNSE